MTGDKGEWRRRLGAARRALPERRAAQDRNGEHLSGALAALAANTGAPHTGDPDGPAPSPVLSGADRVTVCAFLPLPSEALPAAWPGQLAEAGFRVLAPVTRPGAPLDWCRLWAGGPLTRTGLGIDEPTGPVLGPAAARSADVVLVPALAVDAAGVRLGRGGGHYDRTLALLGPICDPSSDPGSNSEPRTASYSSDSDPGVVTGPRTASYSSDPDRDMTPPPAPADRPPLLIAVVFDGEWVAELPREDHDIPVTHVVTPSGGLTPVGARPSGSCY